jgi:hypothetical protein
VTCVVCQQDPARIGVLCEICLGELLTGMITMTLEQVELRTAGATTAALVDAWARIHPLDRKTVIGRAIEEGQGLAILARTVSREHAVIELADTTWAVVDLDSTNGTYVEEDHAVGRVELHHGDRVRFGQVAFFFIEDAPPITPRPRRHHPGRDPCVTGKTLEVPTLELRGDLRPTLEVELHEPTGGGGGVVTIDKIGIQLTLPQFELISMLVDRMRAEASEPPSRRGFVHAAELARALSFDSPAARDEHVRQLVRRVRRALQKVGIPDVIECKYGVGYRLRFMPR